MSSTVYLDVQYTDTEVQKVRKCACDAPTNTHVKSGPCIMHASRDWQLPSKFNLLSEAEELQKTCRRQPNRCDQVKEHQRWSAPLRRRARVTLSSLSSDSFRCVCIISSATACHTYIRKRGERGSTMGTGFRIGSGWDLDEGQDGDLPTLRLLQEVGLRRRRWA
jgi:hypothetical protein